MVVFYRRMPKFEYLKPGSFEDALNIFKGDDAAQFRVYAGGTDLMPKLKKRGIEAPKAVVDLKGLPNLDYIRYSDDEGLAIGALATVYHVSNSPVVKEKYPALAQGAASIASRHIQNRATIVGNICSASPSADSAPSLLAMGAEVKCLSLAGERIVGLDNFFAGPNKNNLLPGEIVAEIRVPPPRPGTKGVYLKLSPREKMDLALVGVAVVGRVEENHVREVCIGLGGVSPTPVRACLAENELNERTLNEGSIIRAAEIASGECSPSFRRASVEYRCMMVEVLVKRGLQSLLAG